MIALFMNDEFNASPMGYHREPNTYRPYMGNVAFKMLERELKIVISREEADMKLVKDTIYKDPDPRERGPREFMEIMTDEVVEEIRKEFETEIKKKCHTTIYQYLHVPNSIFQYPILLYRFSVWVLRPLHQRVTSKVYVQLRSCHTTFINSPLYSTLHAETCLGTQSRCCHLPRHLLDTWDSHFIRSDDCEKRK